MNQISINKNVSVDITHFDWQTSPNGNKFKQVGLRKNGQIPDKWINGVFKNHWIYSFKYEDGSYFEIEIDYNGKFVQLIKC